MYVCLQTEPNLYTVGFYTPDGKWEPDSDHPTREKADDQVAILNGEAITKKRLPDLIKAYAREDGSEGSATYRDIVTDLLHHAKQNLDGFNTEEAIDLISMSAAEVFREEA
jgi:hypothetical protein